MDKLENKIEFTDVSIEHEILIASLCTTFDLEHNYYCDPSGLFAAVIAMEEEIEIIASKFGIAKKYVKLIKSYLD